MKHKTCLLKQCKKQIKLNLKKNLEIYLIILKKMILKYIFVQHHLRYLLNGASEYGLKKKMCLQLDENYRW